MKTQTKYRAALTCAVLLFSFATPTPAQTNLTSAKPKIGIMKFEVASDLKPSLGPFLQNALMEEMLATKRFTVVDWEEIDKVLGYIAKSQTNLSPEEARKQAVHQLGLEKMYLGSVSKLGSKYFVSVKVLNLDLTVAASRKTSVGTEEELDKAIQELAPAMVAAALPAVEADNNTCINNLRMIDGAMQQWALEEKKTESDKPTAENLLPYFREGKLPTCPSGGRYTWGAIKEEPKCSVAGHVLP